MCHNCHVSNDVCSHLDSISACNIDATNDPISEETHISSTDQHERVTRKVLRVTGKVPTTFMQSLIGSLNAMGCSVTIIDECEPRESVRLS